MGNMTEVLLPDVGDFRDVEVIEVLVSPGDQISADDAILTLESDKASMEIPSPGAGIVREVKIVVGQVINEGDLLILLEAEAVEAKPDAAKPAEAEPVRDLAPISRPAPDLPPHPGDKAPKPLPIAPKASDLPQTKAHASPAVRKFARELGVDLGQIKGSGRKNRILKDDVQGYIKQAMSGESKSSMATGLQLPLPPQVDYSQFGEVEHKPLKRIRKISGAHLHKSWVSVPHVTQFDEADITQLEAFRKAHKEEAMQQDIRLTFMPFLLQACAKAISQFEDFNSALSADGEQLVVRKYINIGVAVDTPDGLVVPVVKGVDKKTAFELAADLMMLSNKARAGKLSADDMRGGCFTISSLGGIGGTQFTPIVNAPEVAILGVSRAAMKPVWDGKAFQPRLMMPFSLSYDHRVIDGAAGVRFTTYLGQLLGDIRRLLL